jgi:hypothetical protein
LRKIEIDLLTVNLFSLGQPGGFPNRIVEIVGMKRGNSIDIPAGKRRKARNRRNNLRHKDEHTAEAAAAGRAMIFRCRSRFRFSGRLGSCFTTATAMMRTFHFRRTSASLRCREHLLCSVISQAR